MQTLHDKALNTQTQPLPTTEITRISAQKPK